MIKKLTIVTINLNNALGFKKTADSICRFNIKSDSIEWIVIDGGSTDESLSIIENYKDKIDYFISEGDNGIFDAMNKGVIKSTGDYINFMNSGDCFVNNFLDNSFISELKGDIFYGDIFSLTNGKLSYVQQTNFPDFIYMLGKTICHQSIFIKKSLCEKYLFTNDFSLMGDWIQLFNILMFENPEVTYINRPVCIYDASGLSNQYESLRLEQRKKFLSKHYSDWELKGLNSIVRLRGRKYYNWVLSSLDRWRISFLLKCLSKLK